MEVGRMLTALIFIIVPIAAVIVYISLSWQLFPKECKTNLSGSSFSVLGNLKTCVDNCWSKHNFGGDIYFDDCYVVSINSTSLLSKNRMEKFLNKPAKIKVYFESLEENIEYKIKIRYNSTGKEISLILFEVSLQTTTSTTSSTTSTSTTSTTTTTTLPICSYVYNHPEVAMNNVKIFAFYLVPKDRVPISNWKQKIDTILNRAKIFHEEEFKGYSSIAYEIYDQPVVGSFSVQEYRDKGYAGWYSAMCGQTIPLKIPSLNQFTSYIIFADWGQEDSCSGYYVSKCKGGVDISDIKECGGSGGTYWGNYYGNGYFGCGLVTEEAWKHPEISGTDTVVYHEGFGHCANMPHSDPLDPNGVMGLAYYNCINLANSYIEPQILNKMISC